jgi:hypothetical protein
MTAVVGILNKQAVAIAADSAVTIGSISNHKIFNTANKVFTLSKYHPVGIMLYNSADFMTVPWETIIKVYRQELGDTAFSTVKAYQENFLSFLHLKKFFVGEDVKQQCLREFVLQILDTLTTRVFKENAHLKTLTTDENKKEFILRLQESITNALRRTNGTVLEEFTNYTFEEFLIIANENIMDSIKEYFDKSEITIPEEAVMMVKRLVFMKVSYEEEFSNQTGLVFTGFGYDEIYPQLHAIKVSFAVGSRLRCFVSQRQGISDDVSGIICPFAQTDVIQTILSGIDPSLEDKLFKNLQVFFEKYNRFIMETIGSSNPTLSKQIQDVRANNLRKLFQKEIDEIKRNFFIDPLMNAVSLLSKSDLAEMAESLIYLTYLKRRITFNEESVGGPVDVALISKGDGFIWMKRKHYFKPELNHHFFENYLRRLTNG